MKTNWYLIREMMSAAIDTCERIELAGYTENDRDATIAIEGQNVSVNDLLTSAWTLPENICCRIIRERHKKEADLPYVPEAARILIAMANASAELIGAAETNPASERTREMVDWFRMHAGPAVESAIANRRGGVT